MATVTGLTAARMLAIEAASVVSGEIDDTGHLILTQHDGTEIDAGAITEVIVNGFLETDLPSVYPLGFTLMSISSDNPWASFPTGFGTVVTNHLATDQCIQIVYNISGGASGTLQQWSRSYQSSAGGWTPWMQTMVMNDLIPGSFTQATVFTSYPKGWSRLYYTTTNGSGWDFSNLAGEVITYCHGSDFARQTWTEHVGGGVGASPIEWVRTATATGGWSSWQFVGNGPTAMLTGAVTLVGSATANTTVNTTVTFPVGRFSSAPNFVCCANSTVPGNVALTANAVTASSAKIYMRRTDTSISTTIWWMAVQN